MNTNNNIMITYLKHNDKYNKFNYCAQLRHPIYFSFDVNLDVRAHCVISKFIIKFHFSSNFEITQNTNN